MRLEKSGTYSVGRWREIDMMTLNEAWKRSSEKDRKRLLRELGYHTSWAKVRTIGEMVRRGGGMGGRDLKVLFERYRSSKRGRK